MTTTTDGGYLRQQEYRVRFERGERGAAALAESADGFFAAAA